MNVVVRGPDTDKVLALRVAGMGVRKIAKELGCTVAEVNAALDQVVNSFDGHYRSRAMAVEIERLNEIVQVFYSQMKRGDPGAATIVLKVHERLALLLGLVTPSATITLVEQRAMERERPTSTARIAAILDRLCAPPPMDFGNLTGPAKEPMVEGAEAGAGSEGKPN
jgi:hypothetical protein